MFINNQMIMYKIRHWLFQWKQDEEGDIVFVFANLIGFVKYKEHTIIKIGKTVRNYENAGKYQGTNHD